MVSTGEILAMLGPSGSGKTTILTDLGGRLSGNLSGKITYNGQPFSGSIRRRTGFVAHEDVLQPHLSVFETLLFTALLLLPKSLTREAKVQHVEHVTTDLGLTRCRSSMIGGPLFRGISGGEKERVSIGQEMLINPSLLLLDEPTSGLDSTTAQRILKTIKGLASGSRTVIIHQPSSQLYHMFDKGLDQISRRLATTAITVGHKIQSSVREFLISAYDKNISTRLKSELCSPDATIYNYNKENPTRDDVKVEKWCTTWWH